MKLELEQLAKELDRRKENSKDVVVDSRKTYTQPGLVTGKGEVEGEELKLVIAESKAPSTLWQEKYPLTEWAHQQLAEKTGIPMRYYNRMMDERRFDLLAENVNAWIKTKERRLIRILDGNVRAILSDKYRPMDSYDLLFCAMKEFKQHDVDIHRCDLTETHMYVKAIDPTIFQEWVDKLKRGTEVEVESPTYAVDSVTAKLDISEEKKKDLLDYFTTQEAPTQWGIANAVSRLAQDEEKAENQVELEKAGSDIAILEPEEFLRLTRGG